jgi:beta-lactamase regulating signal transducer with metallopeptidase domain
MNTEIDEICRRVISAMFDGGCRGLLIVAIVWAALKLLPRVNAATRHGAWFAVLLILATLPVAEFWDLRKPVAISSPVEVEKARAMMIEDLVPIEEPETVYVPETISVEAEVVGESQRAEDVAPYLWEVSLPLHVATILVIGWLALALVRVVALLIQLCTLGGISRRALAAPADLKEICGVICREMRLRRSVKLLFSSEISAPMVVGFWNPRVLIPQEIAGDNIAPVLRHELAHVARWDDWANLVQQFLKAIFFCHPGVLIASHRLTAEREIACDDHALAALRAPKDYALFLTEFAGRMRGRDYAAAPAAWSSNSQLKERIVMILDGKRNASPRLDRTRFGAMTAGAVALAVLTLAAGPRLAFAETDKPEAVPAAPAAPAVEAAVAVDVAPAIAATPSVSVTVPAVATISAPDVIPVADAPRPPRPARIGGGGDDIERRLERLERMVESLMGGDRMKIKPPQGPMAMPMPGPTPKPPGDHFHSDFSKEFNRNFEKEWKFDFDHGKIAKKAAEDAKREVDRARVEVERAKREMERGKREGEWARERAELERERAGKQREQAERQRDQAERQREQAEKQISQDRRSLERERQALEEQRRSIEKRIESLEKQIQKRNAENKSDDSGPKEKQ